MTLRRNLILCGFVALSVAGCQQKAADPVDGNGHAVGEQPPGAPERIADRQPAAAAQPDKAVRPDPEINRLDENGFARLHRAAMGGHAEQVRELLAAGADPNVRHGTFQGTPLQYAAARGRVEVVRLLLASKAEVDAADSAGRTPLMWAASEGQTEGARLLVEAGAALEARGRNGSTALKYALDAGHEETANLLLAHGARPVPGPPQPAAAQPPPVTVTPREVQPDPGNLAAYRDRLGETFLFEVVGAPRDSVEMVWGTDVYSDDSTLAAAAVHAGALAPGERGAVQVTILPGQERYAGSERHGILSADYGLWVGSYRVERPRAAPRTPPAGNDAEASAAGSGAEPSSPGILVSGRLTSSQYAARGGRIERAIISVRRLSDNRQVASSVFRSERFEFALPPGRYRLDCTANGSRGATFVPTSREITVPGSDRTLEVGEIDLPSSRTTALYGQPAPALDGIVAWWNTDAVRLEDLRGKVVVLDFFNHTCSICHAHKPDLAELHARYAGGGLAVLAIHDDSLRTLEELTEQMTPILHRVFKGKVPRLPMALDGRGGTSVFRTYGIGAVPAVVLIDQDGRVVRRFHHAGVPELEVEVRRLLETRG